MARHKKEINIKLVAEEAGVSLATVSRVINNRTGVSEEKRRLVLQKIKEPRVRFLPMYQTLTRILFATPAP